MICKQTMRLWVKKGLDRAGRKQYTMALRQRAIILSLIELWLFLITLGSAFKKT